MFAFLDNYFVSEVFVDHLIYLLHKTYTKNFGKT